MARPKGLLMIILINCKKGHMSLRQLCTLQCSDDSEIKTSLSRSVTNIKGRPPRKKNISHSESRRTSLEKGVRLARVFVSWGPV